MSFFWSFTLSLAKYAFNLCCSTFQWLKWIKPTQAYSWQTFLLLSFFSGLMAWPATGWVENAVGVGGQIFLVTGLHWLGVEKSWMPAPWLTGAVICLFLFGNFGEQAREVAVVCWPLISATIASLSGFFDREFNLRRLEIASRQRIVLLFASQALLSCWFQLYFVLQNWVELYPSILSDDFSQSAFTVKVDVQEQPFVSPGVKLLNKTTKRLQADVSSRSWDDTLLWLEQEKYGETLEKIEKQEKEKMLLPSERPFWDIESDRPLPQTEKKLRLTAIWNGTRSHPEANRYEKICTFQPAPPQPNSPNPKEVQIICDEVEEFPLPTPKFLN